MFGLAVAKGGAMRHELKTRPVPFQAIVAGLKTFEIRETRDRTFAVGDVLHLREWFPTDDGEGFYSGRTLTCLVTYVTEPGTWGLPEFLAVLGITGCGHGCGHVDEAVRQ